MLTAMYVLHHSRKDSSTMFLRIFYGYHTDFLRISTGRTRRTLGEHPEKIRKALGAVPKQERRRHEAHATQKRKRSDFIHHFFFLSVFGRDEATRTPDPYVPNVVRYQLRYIPIAHKRLQI